VEKHGKASVTKSVISPIYWLRNPSMTVSDKKLYEIL
jgi:hypothetical protein